MLCPNCHYDNFEGEDSCASCGADLSTSDTPQALADYHDTILGDHLDALGIGSPTLIPSTLPVSEAILRMHQAGADCLLVTDAGQLVGIFTDRDAVVKVAGKNLEDSGVGGFMTPDPVVLRREDTLATAIHKMAVGGFRHIPVVDQGRPIGVVSAADVFRHLVASLG